MTIIIIALLHAVPVLIAATWFKTKSAVFITAALMAVFGFATGGPAYGFIDLLGTSVGVWLSLKMVGGGREAS
ncbi:hypothetical protein [Noviherbaspirillum aridicola]|uniref:Uncharacterized protein n=1 Tax=Noviherbaspirillum aridicola TaxID=2849687 RepID=A0ABQ4Q1Q8_9BURK|nr:hypothetical protein [Noviherbaspirillum aridicola]GIZ51121.1 hypothetical protein NCCP691_11350 [Noviherbaspirillum aridicola]